MKAIAKPLALCAGLALLLAGCAPTAQTKPEAAPPKPQAQAASAAPAAAAKLPAPEAKPKAPEPPAPPAKPQLTLEDIQARRQIEKELERDVETYYGDLKDRNVEKAVEMTTPAAREALKKQLWEFNAQYTVETFDLKEKKIDFDKKPFRADVSMLLTIYEIRSVSPKKMPVASRWQYAGGNWLILPSDK